MTGDLFTGSSATFSGCGLYRYELRRQEQVFVGQPHGRVVAWLMLNPSTAGASEDDPTIRKVRGFSRRWGFEHVVVVNLYAFMSTDPRGLKTAADPVGPENDRHVIRAACEAEVVVCAWGNHADDVRRDAVLALLKPHARKLRCLLITGAEQPGHPLMLPYRLPLQPYP